MKTMTGIRHGLVVVAALTLISGAPVDDAEYLAVAAFQEGRYEDASRYYTLAAMTAEHPGRCAHNHGVVLFHLGKYRDAERLFRSALESHDAESRRPSSLFNLGVCLMQASDGKDPQRLADAIECFRRCAETSPPDSDLAADSRHNLELAKRLWRRARGQEAAPPDRDLTSGSDTPPTAAKDSQSQANPGGTKSSTGSEKPMFIPKTGPNEVTRPMPSDATPPPGAGKHTPIPEDDQLKPLSPGEARQLVRDAMDRIHRERRLLQKPTPTPRPYPDW